VRLAPVLQLFDGSDRPDSDSLQRRRSLARSMDLASMSSVAQVADSGTAPQCLQSLLIRVAGPRMFVFSSSLAGAEGRSRP
jgi:hypothetical protein